MLKSSLLQPQKALETVRVPVTRAQ
jgi:hypothetical protein